MTSRNEKGFTLIEMSIVLVLIGLIIGGILKGQEMISATRLKMTVSQWDGIKASWNAFEDKYNAIPGDYSRASKLVSGSVGDGDGDSKIEVGQAMLVNNTGDTESQAAWDHLSAANLISGIDYAGSDHAGRMRGKVRGTEFMIATDTSGATDGWKDDDSHNVIMLASSSAASPITIVDLEAALTGEQAFEIDRKYDDDQFDAGSIRFGCDGTGGTLGVANNSALDTVPNCLMMFSVGD